MVGPGRGPVNRKVEIMKYGSMKYIEWRTRGKEQPLSLLGITRLVNEGLTEGGGGGEGGEHVVSIRCMGGEGGRREQGEEGGRGGL